MNHDSNLLWLSVSPSLKCLNRQLLSHLVKVAPVRQWEYCQSVDEPCCVDSIVAALHEYVSDRALIEARSGNPNYRVHLLGHGVSGAVALLYARQHPERVASLTLLSVSAMPAVNWQAHYYAMRKLLPCSREIVLTQMIQTLFDRQPVRFSKTLVHLLAKDLDSNLTFHSLAHSARIPKGGTKMPLLVCNGEQDSIVDNQGQVQWYEVMKEGDRMWHCPEGKHFFHFHHAQATAEVIAQHIERARSQTKAPNLTPIVSKTA
ncbi:alpha/beta fold hydrolase [cf. Phormidesmis sp. LEGE 11477]|uniref:alpha/beta fold hydrolase n=1 Tax=cf. Phormidesmis sp. LEGE 11477 TaxID=1828680 RepID=UPI00187F7626|nr:alpha/beta hydrolase [cf. Phormidesmis sp. LEGE 11477]MBE9063507.1 alpha/beta hydrolase [cf. Phormidesmis sp. LEGE 11477]